MRSTRIWMLTLWLVLAACAPIATSQPAATPVPPTIAAPTTVPTDSPATIAPATATLEQAAPTLTPEPTVQPTPAAPVVSGTFVKGEVPVSGSYTLDPASNTLRLSDDFTVGSGPDLYVILSGVGDLSLSYVTFGKQVLAAPLLRLAPLASFSGAQTYTIPAGTDLSQYKSVVIWCNTYNVDFAAAPLAP